MENLIVYNSPYKKTRIGRNADGGYLISELPDKYDLFISGGISNDISFEKHFLSLENNKDLECFAFDGTIDKLPETCDKIQFVKKNLGNHNSNNMTNLLEYMTNYNDIFMKIDIEGHEFRVMPVIINNNYMNKIKQLVIEIHTPADIHLFPNYFKGLQDIDNNFMFNMLKEINKTHTLIHFHGNNGCKMQVIDNIKTPHVFECTFIRNDLFNGIEKIKNTTPLPLNIDYKNVANKPDYSFNYYPFCN